MRQDQPTIDAERGKQLLLNVLELTLRSVNSTAEVFLHRGPFGSRYFGLHAALPLLIIPMFVTLFPQDDPRWLLIFLAAYVLRCLGCRVVSLWRPTQEVFHSQCSGRPYLSLVVPRLDESAIKRFIEPATVMTLAACLLSINRPLGAYCLLASIVLFATLNAVDASQRRRALDLSDSLLDQQAVASRLRALRRDAF